MRIRRGPLFWGLFLVPLGAIPLLARAGILDPAALGDAWRLWPLVLVGFGLALILGRGHAGLLGVSVAAIVLGVAGGSALASGRGWFGMFTSCSDANAATQAVEAHGAFESEATVAIDVGCGTVDVTTGPGTDWQVDARYAEGAPTIDATGTALAVRAPDGADSGRQEWTITLPQSLARDIELTANAVEATLRLPGASIVKLSAVVNAADLLVDAGEGSIAALDLSMNAGRARITLGSGPATGTIDVNAGAVDLCVPADSTLRLSVNDQLTFAHNLEARGLTQAGETWTRSGSSADAIDLRIEGNAASLTLDPEGGCR